MFDPIAQGEPATFAHMTPFEFELLNKLYELIDALEKNPAMQEDYRDRLDVLLSVVEGKLR